MVWGTAEWGKWNNCGRDNERLLYIHSPLSALGANTIVQQDSSVFDGLDVTVTVTAEPKGWLTGCTMFMCQLVSVFIKYMFTCSRKHCTSVECYIVCDHPTNTLLKPTGLAVNSFFKDWWIILWSNHLCNQSQCAAVPEGWWCELQRPDWSHHCMIQMNTQKRFFMLSLLKYFSIHLNLRWGSYLLIGLSFLHSQWNFSNFTTALNVYF